jgi:2-phospho-L-lactate guanylyltransferase
MSWAVLPVKDLVQAKTRLSGVLAPHERRALAQAMVEDVLSVLVQVGPLDGVMLVSDDPAAELLAHKYAIEVISETSLACAGGLNPVVDAATALLHSRGVVDIMVIHGDLPLVQVEDVNALLDIHRAAEVDIVLAPDLEGTGTNVMVFSGTRHPRFNYGQGSCQAHQASAASGGLACELLCNSRLGLDVDTPGDLLHLYHELQAGKRGDYSARVLLGAEIAQRLSIMERSGLSPDLRMGNYDSI